MGNWGENLVMGDWCRKIYFMKLTIEDNMIILYPFLLSYPKLYDKHYSAYVDQPKTECVSRLLIEVWKNNLKECCCDILEVNLYSTIFEIKKFINRREIRFWNRCNHHKRNLPSHLWKSTAICSRIFSWKKKTTTTLQNLHILSILVFRDCIEKYALWGKS